MSTHRSQQSAWPARPRGGRTSAASSWCRRDGSAAARLLGRRARRRPPAGRPDAPVFAVQRRRTKPTATRSACCATPASRGGSQAMHDRVDDGTVLQHQRAEEPLPAGARRQRTLLLAGGIGVTPILAWPKRLASTGAAFEMHYCTRSPERTALSRAHRGDRICATRCTSITTAATPRRSWTWRALLAAPAAGHPPVCLRPAGLHRLRARHRQGAGLAAKRSCTSNTSARRPWTRPATSLRRQAGQSSGKVFTVPAGTRRWSRCWPSRRRDPVFVRAGRVRHLPDARARGRAGPPRHVPDRGRAGGERPVHAVLFAVEDQGAGAGFVGACTRGQDPPSKPGP